MAAIGCLGKVSFEVSDSVVRTLDNMQWSGSANYSTHSLHCGNSLTEFTGRAPDEISFDISLNRSLGVNPMKEITKMWDYLRSGEALPLVIGDHAYGKYRWNIVKLQVKIQHFDAAGNILSAVLGLDLQEYLRGDEP